MKIVWAPLAEARALDAIDYITAERPTVAAVWLEQLLARTDALCRFPRRGREVPEIARKPYREILHPPYRVIYRVDETHIVILTLRHWRRAWDPSEVPPLSLFRPLAHSR